jgi:hypothetical protein
MGSVLGAPASRRLGLTMAAEKAKEPNGAAPDYPKSIGIRKYVPARRRRSQCGANRYGKDTSLYFLLS